jgi:hypothetical protein
LLENAGGVAVNCGGTTLPNVDGLQINDAQIFHAAGTGIQLLGGCSDPRLSGDIVQSNGGYGIEFSGVDLVMNGGVVEENTAGGIYLYSARDINIGGVRRCRRGEHRGRHLP